MKFVKTIIFSMMIAPFLLFSLSGNEIEDLIKTCVDEGHTQGMVVGIITKDGTKFYKNGYTSKEKDMLMDENTVFETGSITKIFTSLLLAEMARNGEVNMTDPIEKFLPEYVKLPEYKGQKITLEHLSKHTAGFPYVPQNFIMSNAYNPFCEYSVEYLFDYFANYELPYAPGTKYQYSNVCIGSLGYILSLQAGKDFDELVQEKILNKLDMHETKIRAHFTEDMEKRFAKAHMRDKEVPHWDIAVFDGAGGLHSTAKDLARFVEANLGFYETDLYPSLQLALIDRAPQDISYLDVGLEWNIDHKYSPEFVYHAGIVGGHQAFIGFCPETEIGVVILSNSCANISDIGKNILNKKWRLNKYRQQAQIVPMMLFQFIGEYEDINDGEKFSLQFLDMGHLSTLLFKKGYYPAVKLYPASDLDFFLKVFPLEMSFIREDGQITGCTVNYDGQLKTFKKIK